MLIAFFAFFFVDGVSVYNFMLSAQKNPTESTPINLSCILRSVNVVCGFYGE